MTANERYVNENNNMKPKDKYKLVNETNNHFIRA